MGRKRTHAALLALALALFGVNAACGSLNQVSSGLTGRPTEHRFEDGVRCYYSQSGSLSCVVAR